MLADGNIPDAYWLLLFLVPSAPQAAIFNAWTHNLLLLFAKAHNPENIQHFPTIFFVVCYVYCLSPCHLCFIL